MGRAYQNRKESMAKTSDQKAKVYSKYGREIYVCAKAGGTDPDGNLALRSLIDRAKKDQVPSHVIEKGIEKAPQPLYSGNHRRLPLHRILPPSPLPSPFLFPSLYYC